MNAAFLRNYLPWSLRGLSPFLNKYGDGILFRSVTRTPPIETAADAATGVHTAVPHRYVFAYLTAIKSLLRYCPEVAVFVHDDGSLREEDKKLIRAHLPGVRVIDRATADAQFLARVGDEFLAKVRRSYTSYLKLFDPTLVSEGRRIIIVDTDVLFLSRPAAILEWIGKGGGPWYHKSESWLKRDGAGAAVPSPPPPSAPGQPEHIQRLVVKRIAEINSELGKSFAFVPGFNSGLIGYEHGTVDYGELKKLLSHLYDLFGERIFRWGAEQTMHGLVLCGQGATALPSDEYMVHTELNSDRAAQAAFVHFIGEFRYHRLRYPLLAGRVIRELSHHRLYASAN